MDRKDIAQYTNAITFLLSKPTVTFLFRFCGSSHPNETIKSETTVMMITFRSNYSKVWKKRRRGFKASFVAGRSSFIVEQDFVPDNYPQRK